MRGIRVTLAVAASVVSLAVATPAWADDNDAQYLQLLADNGLGCGQSVFACPAGDESMIAIGHAICRQLHGGNSARSVGARIVRSKPDVAPEQAAKLVIAAQTAYCP